ncbi:MAG TPA: NB-ARC domain-containing protein [Anaerolineae bacterium]|nr:NB-ARC domain-containing protein [Anaerolineae bacterium]HNU03207.1 NB-ARC domain-containing protein [Anaerolineae bacterium]
MPDAATTYNVTIHGTVYGLAVGDQASAVAGVPANRPVQQPFMTPPLPPQGVHGRDDDLTQVYDLLALGDESACDVPPAALRGLGGIGKTTLATALGRLDFVPRLFPDGVLWVALGPSPTVRLLLDGWGRALGVDLLPERDEDACRDRLRAVLYHRRALLIVDDVWDVVQGQYFLVAGPNCRTLLTTRESPVAYALATRERTLRVDVLKPEAALSLLRRLAPEAVTSDKRAAQRLCERLEYLPLALTLAGRLLAVEADVPARMQRMLGELIERREARLNLLQTEGRLGLSEEEPVSLQAILGLSVNRLDKVDQERFAMASVFGGDPLTWEINAAAYVWECSVTEAEDTVARFIQRGLIERRGERYWMHALLADYAADMLEEMGL